MKNTRHWKSRDAMWRSVERMARRRELKAFEAGWIAGAQRTVDVYHGYGDKSETLGEAWKEHLRRSRAA